MKQASGATQRPALLVASVLAGSWRSVDSQPDISEDELRLISPSLLKSGAGALAWRRIRGSSLSESATGHELKSAYQLHSLQAVIHKTEIEEVITQLNAAGVEPVLVKGWAVARLYPEEGMRPYGDIDLCFLPDQYEKAMSILNNPTCRKYSVDDHDGFSKLDDQNTHEIISHTKPERIGNATFRVLGPEDQLRMLCTHLLRHAAWRPLWLCDVAVAVESRPVLFDWRRCLGADERQADWVASAIGLAHLLLGARVDDTPVSERAEHLPDWLTNRVMRNWDEPFPENYPPLSYVPRMATYLRHPRGVVSALRKRWPDPIEATIRLRGAFNESPRLPFQIAITLRRIVRFLVHNEDERR